jgi:hypothetical protein
MITVPKDDFLPLLYFTSLGLVGLTTIAVFFGVGFSSLAPPHPAVPPTDRVQSAQAPEALAVLPPADNDTAPGPSPELPAGGVGASAAPDASPTRDLPALRSRAIQTTLSPPTRVSHAKRVGVDRHRHERTGKQWAAVWRPDASIGPNPGGGFYGAPNINVGRINP